MIQSYMQVKPLAIQITFSAVWGLDGMLSEEGTSSEEMHHLEAEI